MLRVRIELFMCIPRTVRSFSVPFRGAGDASGRALRASASNGTLDLLCLFIYRGQGNRVRRRIDSPRLDAGNGTGAQGLTLPSLPYLPARADTTMIAAVISTTSLKTLCFCLMLIPCGLSGLRAAI